MDQPHTQLAMHSGLWRVDGVGPIEEDVRLGARVTIYFSGLVENASEKPYLATSLNGLHLVLKAHSSWLYKFKVGSLWINGLSVAQPGEMEKSITIDTDNVRYIPLSHAIKLKDQWANDLLPNFEMGENHKLLAASSYAVIPVLNDPLTKWLIIPASEIFRFYNGASARLLSGSLQGTIHDFINWDKCDMEKETPILHVKKDINRQEAAVLARAYTSKHAWSALHYPHNELASTKLNNASLSDSSKRPLILKATFPFSGVTQLAVSGKRMLLSKKEKDSQWAIFAMEINHCSKAKEFSRIVIVRDKASSRKKHNTDIINNASPNAFSARVDDEYNDVFTDLPADRRLKRLTSLDYSNQFSAFENIELEYRDLSAERDNRSPRATTDLLINSLTFEDGRYTADAKGNLGVSIFQSQDYQVDRELKSFIEMLAELRIRTSESDWEIRTRKLNGAVSYGVADLITNFPDKVGKKRTWHKIITPEGYERPRKVIWTELIKSKTQYIYLLEMELKPGESGQCTLLLHDKNFQKMDDQFLKELLILTAIQNRWPALDKKWSKKSYQYRADRILMKANMCRIRHPSLGKHVTNTSPPRSSPNTAEAKEWANIILERIYNFVPNTK